MQEIPARFGPEIHAAQNGDRVILRAYCAFRLQFLAYNCNDFAPLLMARGNHQRGFAGPECLQMLLDRSLVQFYVIDDLFDDSKVLQLFPTCLESACFQILDRRF